MSNFWADLGELTREVFIAVTDKKPEDVFFARIKSSTKKSAKEAAIESLDADGMIRRLDERIPDYARTVERCLGEAIRAAETSDLLEIKRFGRLRNDDLSRCLVPVPNILLDKVRPRNLKWPLMFFTYMQGNPDPDYKYEAGIERTVAAACKKASEEYFSSEEIQDLVQTELVKSVAMNEDFQRIIMTELKDTGKWVKKEGKDAIQAHYHAVAADRVHDAIHHAVVVASGTTGGAVAIKVITAALALSAVKMAIAKAAVIAMGSSTVYGIVAAVAKHCSITVLAVCFLGHAAASAFVGAVALPIITAVIAYQWNTLPDTIAGKLAPKVADEVRKQAGTVNRSIVEQIKKTFVEQVLDLPNEMLEKIHEAAMEELDT